MAGGEALVIGQECDGSPRCGRDWLSGEGAPVGGGGWVGSGVRGVGRRPGSLRGTCAGQGAGSHPLGGGGVLGRT